MAKTNANIDSTKQNDLYLVYPTTPDHLKYCHSFIKLTSYSYDRTLYGQTNNQTSENQIALVKDITRQVFLPIPTEGLNFNDSIDYEGVKGGATLTKKFFTLVAEGVRTNIAPIAAYEDIMKSLSGNALNNFMANLFNGMTLREYTFSWDFIPYSQADANILKFIINGIRTSALPRYDNNSWAIKFPDFWIVEPYVNDKLLFELNYLVLTDISVSFDNPNGTTFFYDGNPVTTKMTLKFKEVFPSGNELVQQFI